MPHTFRNWRLLAVIVSGTAILAGLLLVHGRRDRAPKAGMMDDGEKKQAAPRVRSGTPRTGRGEAMEPASASGEAGGSVEAWMADADAAGSADPQEVADSSTPAQQGDSTNLQQVDLANPQEDGSPVQVDEGEGIPGAVDISDIKTPADFAARLDRAETHEEMAEIAAAVLESGDPAKVGALLGAIEASEGADRDTLARTLQALHDPQAAPDLLAFLVRNVNDAVVADQASEALGRIMAPEHIALIAAAMPDGDENPQLRNYLIQTLASVGSGETVVALGDLCLNTRDPDLHSAAASALGAIGTPHAVATLVAFIEQTGLDDVEEPVAQALMTSANKESMELLQDRSENSTNRVVRYAATQALAMLNDTAADQKGTPDEPPPDAFIELPHEGEQPEVDKTAPEAK